MVMLFLLSTIFSPVPMLPFSAKFSWIILQVSAAASTVAVATIKAKAETRKVIEVKVFAEKGCTGPGEKKS